MEIEEIREYCLKCKNKPCGNVGCPLQNDIPAFIQEKDIEKAYNILTKTTVLPAICSRVCQFSKQCKGACVRGIKGDSVEINVIEKFIADAAIENNYELKKSEEPILKESKKVCVIGSGPSGLTCAAYLAMNNADVTIYEKNEKLGGLLEYGIPNFRLDKNIVQNSIDKIINLGIKTKLKTVVGKDISLEEFLKEYDAIYVSAGANEPNNTLKGENVLSGNKLLEKLNKGEQQNIFDGKSIAISGGGNVAMDCARTLKRLGANVAVIYRRSLKEMPAEKTEVEQAQKENIEILFQTNILKFDSKTKKMELIKTRLIEKNGQTRAEPVNIENTNYTRNFDYCVLATGSKVNNEFIKTLHVDTNEKGYINVNDKYQTSNEKIFAGGDIIGSRQTVANASADGREASKNILKYLLKSNL